MNHFDVVVLGAGSTGELVATTLAKAGRSVALVEKNRVGGECAYVSCMPSKSMLRSAHVRDIAKHVLEFGAAQSNSELGQDQNAYKSAAKRRDLIVENRDDAKSAAGAIASGVKLFRGDGVITDLNELTVNSQQLGWTDLVIATGSSANIPEIAGLNDVNFWTTDQALSADKVPDSALIIGGGPAACELAQIFCRFGARTKIVEVGPQLAGKENPEIAKRLAENLIAEGVEVLLSTEVIKVEKAESKKIKVHFSTGKFAEVDQLIVATGRHPNSLGLNLEILGVQLTDKGAVPIDQTCRVLGQTNVWAGGDVTALAPFTHTANYQGRIIIENILGNSKQANYTAIPRAIYTDPTVASVGLAASEDEKNPFISAQVDLETTSRNSTDGESGGLLILTADPARGVLVGAFAIGPNADMWLAEATVAIRAEVPLEVLSDVVHAFPTYGEAFEQPIRELVQLCKSKR